MITYLNFFFAIVNTLRTLLQFTNSEPSDWLDVTIDAVNDVHEIVITASASSSEWNIQNLLVVGCWEQGQAL